MGPARAATEPLFPSLLCVDVSVAVPMLLRGLEEARGLRWAVAMSPAQPP